MATKSNVKKKSRPGGRTEQNRQAVAIAVLKLIGQGKLDFEVQEVAALAGVHRTTLFRRWPDRASLIAEALAEHASAVSVTFSGNWEVDLHSIGYALRDFLSDPVELSMNRMLAATGNEEFHEQMTSHWTPIMESLHSPILDAQARGEISEEVDAETTISLLVSAVVTETVFTRTMPNNERIDRIVGQIIRGCS